jgi:hypothetical protein
VKEEYYIPNTSGERISFDGKEYIFAEDLRDEISPPQNPDDPADRAQISYRAQVIDPAAPERLLELYYVPILVCDDPLFNYKTAEILGIIETETD